MLTGLVSDCGGRVVAAAQTRARHRLLACDGYPREGTLCRARADVDQRRS